MKQAEGRERPAIRYVGHFVVFALALIAGAAALLWRPSGSDAQVKPEARPKDPPGILLDENHRVGSPHVAGNLAVFPIYAKTQQEIGEFTTLDAALEKGTAVVRELGAEAQPPPAPGAQGVMTNASGDAPRVNTLVIENKGKLPILVLAGTVVKGGKQDRQIGEDFVISAGSTTPVDAYCVERGRWNGERDGQNTGGVFQATKMLATSKVRAAGQHQKNQSGVWAEVSAVNAANKKSSASDTLMATLDDKEVAAKRAAVAGKVNGFLGSAEQKERIVGLAYAVDGKVRSVRWFWSHTLFELHRDTLVQTAAVEALTAESAGGAGAAKAPAIAPGAVVQFIADIKRSAEEARTTRAGNVNAYRASEQGYGSKTMMPPAAASPTAMPEAAAAPVTPVTPVTVDFVAK